MTLLGIILIKKTFKKFLGTNNNNELESSNC